MPRAEARLKQIEEHIDNMGGEEEVAQRFETLQLHAGECFGSRCYEKSRGDI